VSKKKGFKLVIAVFMGIFLLGAAVSSVTAAAGDSEENPRKQEMKRGFLKAERRGDFWDCVQELTGLDAAGIREQLKSGKTIAEILAAAGISQEELQEKIKEKRDAKLKELLESGKIDQEKYDELIAKEVIPREFWRMGSAKGFSRGSNLQKLLEDGTKSQEQYDAIHDALTEVREKIAALKDELKDMDQEARCEKTSEVKKEALQKLLDEGIISQEMYDRMISGIGQGFKYNSGPGGHKKGSFLRGCMNLNQSE